MPPIFWTLPCTGDTVMSRTGSTGQQTLNECVPRWEVGEAKRGKGHRACLGCREAAVAITWPEKAF